MAVKPAAHAARVVFAATRPMPSKSIADSVLGIESIPAEPQQQATRGGDSQIVRQHRAAAVALELAAEARAENDGARQGNEAADGVYYRGTGEIVEAGADPGKVVAG